MTNSRAGSLDVMYLSLFSIADMVSNVKQMSNILILGLNLFYSLRGLMA